MIVDDCSQGGVCDPGGGGGGSDDFCRMGSNACGGTWALIQGFLGTSNAAEATSYTEVPSGTNALVVSLLGGGIIKRGTLISLPTAFNLGCLKTNAPTCSDTWTGPNTCSNGEFNFLAAGAYHVVAFASKRYEGDTSDTDQCNPISLWGEVVSFAGSGGGGGTPSDGSDPGEGNIVVTVEPTNSSGCDHYTVTFLELGDDGSVKGSAQMDLQVC